MNWTYQVSPTQWLFRSIHWIVTSPGRPARIDAAGENAISVAPGANACLSPAHIDAHADFIRSSALVILQMEIPVATTRQVLKLTAAANTPVMLNYAPVVSRDLVLDSSA